MEAQISQSGQAVANLSHCRLSTEDSATRSRRRSQLIRLIWCQLNLASLHWFRHSSKWTLSNSAVEPHSFIHSIIIQNVNVTNEARAHFVVHDITSRAHFGTERKRAICLKTCNVASTCVEREATSGDMLLTLESWPLSRKYVCETVG